MFPATPSVLLPARALPREGPNGPEPRLVWFSHAYTRDIENCLKSETSISAERFFKRGVGQVIGVRGGACICACVRLGDRRCWHVPVCQRAASRMGLRRPARGF